MGLYGTKKDVNKKVDKKKYDFKFGGWIWFCIILAFVFWAFWVIMPSWALHMDAQYGIENQALWNATLAFTILFALSGLIVGVTGLLAMARVDDQDDFAEFPILLFGGLFVITIFFVLLGLYIAL